MVTSEELRPIAPAAMVDLGDVPLSEILALGPEVLDMTIGRAVPGRSAGTAPVAAFQSAL
ncbi:MAG TPA: FxSxx-COOH cyclophane-containing RiPP peptide [Trebonia sp.]|nr:FxSxx-COOH cyclophane-containing RiPP peptide [Trebonia sp.]